MKSGDEVRIKKPGHLIDGEITNIVAINKDNDRPVKVVIHGEWFLRLNEVVLLSEKPTETIKSEKVINAKPVKKSGLKRSYVRKSEKVVDKRVKRKYNKREKKD